MKLLGLTGASGALIGCDAPSMVNLEEGKETVVSYLLPEENVVPGLGVWYASMCLQCAAGCGVHGRVREGRPLKLEGNPDSPINIGKSCQMGQAGLQAHYNPDRVTQPLLRKKGKLVESSWDEALELISEHVGASSNLAEDRVAWFTGTISGHQNVLLNNHLNALNSSHHYAFEVVNRAVSRAVNQAMLSDPSPKFNFSKAELILSFGADFLGTWVSPVHFAGQFAKFRSLPNRGSLIQVESKMSLTGANADLWLAAPAGSEGLLALGIANYLLKHGKAEFAQDVPQEILDFVGRYDSRNVAETTGVEYEQLRRIAKALEKRSPSLVLAGAAVEGQVDGYAAVAAIQLLNLILGNVGKTIVPSTELPLPQLQVKNGSTADLLAFSKAVAEKKLDVVFFHGANPLFNAPESLNLKENLQNVGLKVALSQFPDETAMEADVVLPISSHLEDWGTHVADYQPSGTVLGFQQPLMEALHRETRGFGDVMLDLLKMVRPGEYNAFKDYYAYLRNAVAGMQGQVADPLLSAKRFWQNTLSSGQIQLEGETKEFNVNVRPVDVAMSASSADYPLMLVPSPRLGLFDGRHANLPWLQESPDQISKVVWDSWAEIHPTTAAKMRVEHGDLIKLSSASGALQVKAYVTKSVHKSVVAVPLGQGHTEYGRYANGVGVNPLTILDLKKEKVTGELAMYATAVKLESLGKQGTLVRMGGTDSQQGRQFVRTVPTYKPEGV